MSSLFKLLIAVVVAGLLLYFILSIFVFPKTDFYPEIAKQISLAQQSPGDPFCSKLNLKKENFINTKTLSQQYVLKDKRVFVWFSSINNNSDILTTDNSSSFIATKDYSSYNFCAICFPSVIFSEYPDMQNIIAKNNQFCEVVFGSVLTQLNYEFKKFSENELQGYKQISLAQIPKGYIYAFYVLNNEQNDLVNLDSLSYLKSTLDKNFDKILYYTNTKDMNLEIPKAGEKLILQALIPESRNIFNTAVLPAKFYIQNIDIKPNDSYIAKNCKATTKEKKGINYDLQKCEYYNYCEGCFLASYCSDAWTAKGEQVETATVDHAKSYGNIEECN